jgi:predicted AlkP superfamily pyrophosphatase or phosphodiesterase
LDNFNMMRANRVRRSLSLLFFASLPFTAVVLDAADLPKVPAKPPKLVIAIVIDQFRYDYLLRFRGDYNSGLKRLLDQGAVFTDAHYIHATTVTAVGHSTFLSGATPSVSGIIGNEWFDRATGKAVTSVSDPATKLVGGVSDREGSSPRRLITSTVTDELKMRFPESHVIGVSIKDRSAILPAGHMADAAYWYDDDSNHWVTSSYFRADLPEWAKRVNDEKYFQRSVGARWLPFDAKDDKATPFCSMTKGTDVRFCGSIEATPWGNEMIEQFAEAALVGEQLGKHTTTDILTVSFSSNDYVGHAVGPDDPHRSPDWKIVRRRSEKRGHAEYTGCADRRSRRRTGAGSQHRAQDAGRTSLRCRAIAGREQRIGETFRPRKMAVARSGPGPVFESRIDSRTPAQPRGFRKSRRRSRSRTAAHCARLYAFRSRGGTRPAR